MLNKKSILPYVVAADWLAATAAWLAFVALRTHVFADLKPSMFFDALGSAAVIGSAWTLLYAFCGFYTDFFRKGRAKEVGTLLWINLVGVALLFALIILDAVFLSQEGYDSYVSAYRNVIKYFVVHAGVSMVVKFLTMSWSKWLLRRGVVGFRTIMVGSFANAHEIYLEITQNNPHLGLQFIGFVYVDPDNILESLQRDMPNLGSYHNLEPLLEHEKVEQVILALETDEHRTIEKVLSYLEGYELHISILPDMYQILLGSVKVTHILGTPLIEIKRSLLPVWQAVTKRAIDIVTSVLVLITFSWLYAFVAFMVRMSSQGPIFFRQERIGKGGKPFNIIKFRSMYTDAERLGPQLASNNDSRVTPWGKFMRKTRLDEIPQFWNVLVGEMSLVGPRPERQFFIDQIVQVAPHYKHLCRVRPGITSLGQVKFGYASNVEQMVRRLRYDIIYIENMSLLMDFRIIFYTVWTVLMGRGK